MKKNLMIMGTSSGAGKSLFVTALCRIFHEDGYKVSPFKAQNMALNSYITKEGLEMGRAQVAQAEASKIEASVEMNPILLKPSSMNKIQIIVEGKVFGNMSGTEYNSYKKNFIPIIEKNYKKLEKENDFIIIEGAGSPSEINIEEEDISNFGTANLVDAPVILVADIDRGGVFASIYGTIMLLKEKERKMIKGIVINKFRGNNSVLKKGFEKIEKMTGVPTLGVLPYFNIDVEDEDSLSEKYNSYKENNIKNNKNIKVSVINLKHISNITDINSLAINEDVEIKFINNSSELGDEDLIIIPGTKNTIEDMIYIRNNGIAKKIKSIYEKNKKVFIVGICGGLQMLGKKIEDPHEIEGSVQSIDGLNILNYTTFIDKIKTTIQYKNKIKCNEGLLSSVDGIEVKGYEIHQGVSEGEEINLTSDNRLILTSKENVIATYLHGIFDNKEFTDLILNKIREYKNLNKLNTISYEEYKEQEYKKLADIVRENLEIEKIYEIIKRGN